ncbi:TetR family transcriptional regulator [Saccharopolyspora terrae]|uniref:TetR family transcriptional regulator n=1 Tax=Saccharopolyspora terrae TaxID=2530384 RepID=A0A4R4VKP0_9PSEU|nr:TetR family transcriptional regulator [Saccharopolyspora terrae]TDD06328.1 TetR family transcriptional regulator [Saccharopolyspora terrae]
MEEAPHPPHTRSDLVGETIRAARQSRGTSLRDLAKRIDVSPATLSAIETGKTGVSVARLHVIATELATTASDLLSGLSAEAARPWPPAAPGHPGTRTDNWRDFPPLAIDPVLTAAIGAFVETGYHGATMRSIAQRAEMSVPGVYHHYSSKQELLVTCLDISMDELHWRVPAARREGRSAHLRVALMVECLALFHTHRHDLAFIGASEMRGLEPASRRRIAGLRNDIQGMLDEEVDTAIGEGTLTTSNPRSATRAISTMCTSLPQWFRPAGPATPEQIAIDYAQFALDLLGYHPRTQLSPEA